ncbi:MAG: amidohydrolase family protein [Planctomycetota bacterium]|jgi:cytosine/adenosine deaminase-related metal-dependent hydrolase|nr:amidohydrolase family protein [Planctomycetota bacterium]MDP6761570.1 amidohydrolase family protein [Planctomycetota bacterium]MDP6990976.1 amidohydrolase family protein [Planctomycetota bacterium]
MEPTVVTARALLCAPDRWLAGGGLVLEDGWVRAVLESPRAVAAAGVRACDLGDVLLTPGLVNAHAHLELGSLAGEVSPAEGFVSWVEGLIEAKAGAGVRAFERAATEGAAHLMAGGTTCVGDVDSTGASRSALGAGGPRARIYREVLDAGDERRTPVALERLRGMPGEDDALRSWGLAPHAPYTVSPALFAACGELGRQRGLATTIHWAETVEEGDWLERGEGDFGRLLRHSPGVSGLDAIEAAGLLGPATSLVHANHARPSERERIARAGAVVVHCPGTHAFFERAPFGFAAWREAGVELALGTDSLASNDVLDLGAEMARARTTGNLDPEVVWTMATLGGARAVGLAGAVGTLAEGARADLVAWPWCGDGAREALDALTSHALCPRAVWVGGRAVQTPS